MHDSIVLSYEMNFQKKIFTMYTYDEEADAKGRFQATDVLTYHFEDVLECNIILSIEESDILDFYIENEVLLRTKKEYCWPTIYTDKKDLEEKFVQNNYKYIKFYSSYGMCGWIIARGYKVELNLSV